VTQISDELEEVERGGRTVMMLAIPWNRFVMVDI
jgi:hypothetical protein